MMMIPMKMSRTVLTSDTSDDHESDNSDHEEDELNVHTHDAKDNHYHDGDSDIELNPAVFPNDEAYA